jgi:hypothetical protein
VTTPSGPPVLEALAERILGGAAPLQVRSAAARGALPLPRTSLVRLYLHLLDDAEPQIRKDAETSLQALATADIREILGDPACTPPVLAHFAPRAARDESLAEKIAFHVQAPEEALCTLAAQGNSGVIDLVLTNEERLLRWPGLLDRLSTNPALRPHQRGRILDLLDRVSRVGAPGDDAEGVPGLEGLGMEEAARLLQVDVGELFAASEILDGEEFEQSDDPMVRSAYRRILTLNTAQKALLAMKGGREERMILVRDTNKIVALSVLKNPRLGEDEAARIASLRSVADEVLRTLGGHREFVKSYSVIAALVRNPRTPPGISTNFVGRLVNKDLKILGMDKNVPEIIRRMAKRTFELRTQKSAPSFRKKH